MDTRRWEPPKLRFEVERHGAMMAGGSPRAEVQSWGVDGDTGSAEVEDVRPRQIHPMAGRLDVRLLAVQTADLVSAGAADDRLEWKPGGDRVHIRVGQIIPADG